MLLINIVHISMSIKCCVYWTLSMAVIVLCKFSLSYSKYWCINSWVIDIWIRPACVTSMIKLIITYNINVQEQLKNPTGSSLEHWVLARLERRVNALLLHRRSIIIYIIICKTSAVILFYLGWLCTNLSLSNSTAAVRSLFFWHHTRSFACPPLITCRLAQYPTFTRNKILLFVC